MRSAFLTLLFVIIWGGATASEITTVERRHQEWEQPKFGRTVVLNPVLHLPPGPGPFSLVIIVNSSAGARDIFLTEWPRALNDAGIAAAALDTFSPRGIVSTTRDQSQISAFTMALDALAVARHFAADVRIADGRIAVSGHSKGATAALHLASKSFYERFGVEAVFTGAAAFSPDCFVQLPAAGTAFPIYAQTGAKDDVTPPAYCIPLFAALDGKPHTARFEIVPDIWHSWSIDGPRVHFVENLPNVARGPCAAEGPFVMEAAQRYRSVPTGTVVSLADFRHRCAGGFGKTFGGGREGLTAAFARAITWLRTGTAL